MIRIIVALTIFSMMASFPAAAQPDDWPKSIWKKAKKDRAKARKKKRIRTSRIKTGSIKKRAGLQPQQCVTAVSVVGDQAASTSGAKSQAEKAWQQQVRFLNGELYSDPRYAGAISFRCVDSSIRNFANRATEVVGINSQLKRCSMTAVPCRAPKVFEVGK